MAWTALHTVRQRISRILWVPADAAGVVVAALLALSVAWAGLALGAQARHVAKSRHALGLIVAWRDARLAAATQATGRLALTRAPRVWQEGATNPASAAARRGLHHEIGGAHAIARLARQRLYDAQAAYTALRLAPIGSLAAVIWRFPGEV